MPSLRTVLADRFYIRLPCRSNLSTSTGFTYCFNVLQFYRRIYTINTDNKGRLSIWATFGLELCKNYRPYNLKRGPLEIQHPKFENIVSKMMTGLILPRHGVIQDGNEFEPPRDKTNKMACASSEHSDQPGHPPSLIRVFAVRMKKAWVLSYPLSAQRRLIRLGGCPG